MGQTLSLRMLLHMQILHIILGVYVMVGEIIVKFAQFYCSY